MRVELLPSNIGGPADMQFGMSLLINDDLAIDAGTLGFLWPLERQQKVQHVLLSHSHVDHTATLPIFLDNVYEPRPGCPTVYTGLETIECLRRNVFNDSLWPDFIRLSLEEFPFLTLQQIRSEEVIALPGGTRFIPVLLNHVIPTMGFIVEDQSAAVAFVSDTGPTDRIWEVLQQQPRLVAVFLECSFPNHLEWLAVKSGHLCPRLFALELQKIPTQIPVIAYHLKPAFQRTIAAELAALNRPGLELALSGRCYEFNA
jgi:cAMP phosphodiesterase